ncbi:hypothetical protein BKA65DRAFT_259321 [Rhexocercosporidium sp. MPI-PUGE-AT-0058]|nr:hypothetical protein BKA65DRAFT_259321 [Rhexocercosporidium sp. MPI-PUGE-AT-0058]
MHASMRMCWWTSVVVQGALEYRVLSTEGTEESMYPSFFRGFCSLFLFLFLSRYTVLFSLRAEYEAERCLGTLGEVRRGTVGRLDGGDSWLR